MISLFVSFKDFSTRVKSFDYVLYIFYHSLWFINLMVILLYFLVNSHLYQLVTKLFEFGDHDASKSDDFKLLLEF